MKFTMDDTEIRTSYNTAKNRQAQVQVLAELNATTPAAMAAKLRELGCDVPEPPEAEMPAPEPAPETAAPVSHSPMAVQ